jgi:hypothetical protein
MIENSHHRKIGISRKGEDELEARQRTRRQQKGVPSTAPPEISEEQRKIRPSYY